MEKSKFLFGALGFMALGLASCSSDDLGVNNEVVQKDEVRYMRVAISSPSAVSSRADFADATDAENAVNNMYFKFFDRNGNCVSNTPATDVTFVDAEAPDSPNVGKIKEAIVKCTLSEGAGMPAYVLCFINPTNWSDIESTNIVMEDFRTRIRESFMQNEFFSMNNSVYYGTDDVSGATNVKISGTPIIYDQLFSSEAEAQAATGESIVNIYVERYAAKVQFSVAASQMEPTITVDGKTLTFYPEAWTINADDPTMYAVKRYDNSNANTDVIPTLGDVNTMLSGWTTWNDPTNHRSYWACSPSYYATNYPEVSDQIADYWNATEGLTGTGAGEVNLQENGQLVEGAPNALKYYSYNQITGTGDSKGLTDFTATVDGETNVTTYPTKYVMENTVSDKALTSKNPKAAVPSVLMVGHYTITDVPEGTSFYIYDNKIYYTNSTYGTSMMDKFLSNNDVLYVATNDATTPYAKLNVANATTAIRAALKVQHPALSVRGTLPVPHRNVTLQIADLGTINNLYYSPNGTNRYIQVTAANVDQVNSVLWNQLQAAEAYTNGKCYFSIPIKHLGWFERATKPETAQGGIDWPNVRVGDFGLVRNHVYNISVTSITGRATGIENLNYPLVPSADIDSYWIKYKLNILNWRVVPTQEVNLN